MSRVVSILVLFTASLTGALFSQATPKLVAFASLLGNPQPYLGQMIALHGVIDKSDEAAGGFKLIQAKSSREQTSFLRATWIKGATVVPLQNGQDAVAIGQIQIRDNAPIFQIANIITDKDAIRRLIRSSERRPRPGDDLGHDAQPSKSISD
jgi:hypothetical protein